MMLLDPFLYDFVAEHQHALREAAEGSGCAGTRVPGWWRLRIGMAGEWRAVRSVAPQRLICRRLLACSHASPRAFVGHDV
jgi:hypothetical protein